MLEPHVIELDAALRVDEIDRTRMIGDRCREVEHLEQRSNDTSAVRMSTREFVSCARGWYICPT